MGEQKKSHKFMSSAAWIWNSLEHATEALAHASHCQAMLTFLGISGWTSEAELD